jgi:hypothetical protein
MYDYAGVCLCIPTDQASVCMHPDLDAYVGYIRLCLEAYRDVDRFRNIYLYGCLYPCTCTLAHIDI